MPGEFHGQSSLAGYSPGGHQQSDTTEHALVHRDGNTQVEGQVNSWSTVRSGAPLASRPRLPCSRHRRGAPWLRQASCLQGPAHSGASGPAQHTVGPQALWSQGRPVPVGTVVPAGVGQIRRDRVTFAVKALLSHHHSSSSYRSWLIQQVLTENTAETALTARRFASEFRQVSEGEFKNF